MKPKIIIMIVTIITKATKLIIVIFSNNYNNKFVIMKIILLFTWCCRLTKRVEMNILLMYSGHFNLCYVSATRVHCANSVSKYHKNRTGLRGSVATWRCLNKAVSVYCFQVWKFRFAVLLCWTPSCGRA